MDRKGGDKNNKGGGVHKKDVVQNPQRFSWRKAKKKPLSSETDKTQHVVVPAEKSLSNAQNKAFNSYQGREKVKLEFNADPEQFKAQIKNELVDSQGYTLPVPPPTTSAKDHDQFVLLGANPEATNNKQAYNPSDKSVDISADDLSPSNMVDAMVAGTASRIDRHNAGRIKQLQEENNSLRSQVGLTFNSLDRDFRRFITSLESGDVVERLKSVTSYVKSGSYAQKFGVERSTAMVKPIEINNLVDNISKSVDSLATLLQDRNISGQHDILRKLQGAKTDIEDIAKIHTNNKKYLLFFQESLNRLFEDLLKSVNHGMRDEISTRVDRLVAKKSEEIERHLQEQYKTELQRIHLLEQDNAELLAKLESAKNLQDIADLQEKQIQTLSIDLEKAQEQEERSTEAHLAECNKNKKKDEILKAQENQIKVLTEENNQLKYQLEEFAGFAALKENYVVLSLKNEELYKEVERFKQKLEELTKENQQLKEGFKQRTNSLLEEHEQKLINIGELSKQQKQQSDTIIESLKGQLTQAQKTIEELKQQNSILREQESEFINQLNDSKADKQIAEEKVVILTEQLRRNQETLKEARKSNEDMDRQLKTAEKDLSNTQTELTNLNREYNRLTADKEQLEREKAALETELQPLRDVNMTIDELIDVAAHAEQRKKENENLRQAINEKERELLNKQAELDNITSQLETKGTELRDKQEELTLLQEECKKLAEDKTAAEQTFAEQLKNLEHQLNTAKSELRTQQEVYKQQLAELTQQFDQYKIKAKQDLEEQERSLKRGYDTALAVARDSHAAEKADLTEQHQQELEKQKEDFAAERQKLKDEHDAAIDRLNATHQEELNKLRADLEAQHQLELEEKTREFNEKKLELEKAYDAAVTGLQDKHNAEIAKLDTDHQEALNELRKTLEETHAQAIKELRQKKEQEYHKLEEQYHELEKDFQALREFYEEDASAPDNATEDVDVSYSDAYAGQEEELGIEKTVEKFHYKELSKKLKTALQKIATLQAEKDQLAKRLEEEKKIFETRLQAEKAFNQFLNESTEREAPPHHDKLKEAETAQAMLKAQLDDIEQRYKDDMIEAQSNLTSLNKQNDENKRQFQNNLDELRKQHDQQLEYLRKWHIQDLQEKDQEILDMQITYQQELKHLQQQFERADLLKLQEYQQLEQHYRQLAQEKQQIEQQLNNKQNLAAQDESSKEQLNKLRSYYTTLQDRLTSTQQEMSQLAKLRQQDQDSYKTKEAEWQLKIEQLQAEQKKLLAIKQATEQQQKKVTRDQAVATEPEVAKKPEQEDKALKAQPVQELTTQNIRPYAAIPNYAAPAFTANNYGYGAINAAAYSPKPIQQPLTVKAQPQVATTPIARVRDSVAISANNNNFVNNATRGNLDPNKATIVGGTGVTATSGTMAGLCAAGLFGGAAVIPASLAFGLCAAGSATFTGAKAVNKPNGFAQRIANERSFASAELGA